MLCVFPVDSAAACRVRAFGLGGEHRWEQPAQPERHSLLFSTDFLFLLSKEDAGLVDSSPHNSPLPPFGCDTLSHAAAAAAALPANLTARTGNPPPVTARRSTSPPLASHVCA